MTTSEREALAFLPAALEVVETPASPLGRWAGLTLCGIFAAAGLWAWFGHVDVVAVAQGRIVPSGEVKVIQAPELAKITAIHVQDGQHVDAGEVLVELDPTDAKADAIRYGRELLESQLQMARLQALLTAVDQDAPTATLTPPAEAPADLVARHQALLSSTLAEHRASIAAIEAEAAKTQAERRTLEAEIAKLDATLPLIRKKAEARTQLAARGNAPMLDVLGDQQAQLTAEHDRQVSISRLSEEDAALASLAQSRARTRAEFMAKQAQDLVDAGRTAEAAAQELAKARERLSRRNLVSPIAGTVQQLALHTVGGMTDEAQAVMVVVPQDATLEVEVLVENKDIGFVEAGQHAALKLETFPFTRYGLVDGVVQRVSRDAVTQQQNAQQQSKNTAPSQQPQPQGALYAARISLGRTTMNVDGRTVPMTPGMAVTAEIKTGQRRILEFLLNPIKKHAQEAGKER